MLSKITLSRQASLTLFGLGLLLTIFSVGVIASHVRTFSVKRDTAVMIGTALPELRTSVALLRSSVEAETVFARQARSAREEQAQALVLPSSSPVPRVVLTMEQLSLALRDASDGNFSLQSLRFDPATENHGSHKTRKAAVLLKGSYQDVSRLIAALSSAGDMMVRDALHDGVEGAFLRQISTDEPLALKAAQDFLYLDLLEYALSPDIAEQGALSAVSDSLRPDLTQLLLQGGLAEVRMALGPVAARLKERNVWPLPLVEVQALEREGEVFRLEIVAFSR